MTTENQPALRASRAVAVYQPTPTPTPAPAMRLSTGLFVTSAVGLLIVALSYSADRSIQAGLIGVATLAVLAVAVTERIREHRT
ncbi:hypothetical protein [Salinispora arenicola]|uniref:hypothetical protein n=1 Tax=Salinispora arenicola TaxID=168697 RepID=UPI00169EF6E6|nr:hypothetical protein [Salinispora arenicola]NIL57099.1 hypothetical protein [Salinispora arenicola]NIL62680.1 hypothetical protein [Salinispora arenicola]